MHKLLVMFTGGTIGSKTADQIIDVESSSYFILDLYKQLTEHRDDIEFHTIQPMNQLSENLHPHHWKQMHQALQQADWSSYDGVIITHGSDTLAYTSAAFSMMFADSSVPIILIAGNYPLDHERSNGLLNFTHAVEFICKTSLPGVFTIYENRDGQSQIHLASRIQQCRHFTDDFESTYNEPFGVMTASHFQWNDYDLNPSIEQLKHWQYRRQVVSSWMTEPDFTSDIVFLRPYPGFQARYIQWGDKKPKAVLLDTYHSGTGSIRADEGQSYADLVRRCVQEQIPVYLVPIKNPNGALYSSTSELIDYGAVPMENISAECALVKLMHSYGTLAKEKIESYLNTELFFEHHQLNHRVET
ncbi:asparaginase [Marinicrinis lubricantis]|uniref:asparaginase n=1 Tax=Marinicrinis lubricantis TaxID=2086470 RepID=A0ABW1IL92_9BACL